MKKRCLTIKIVFDVKAIEVYEYEARVVGPYTINGASADIWLINVFDNINEHLGFEDTLWHVTPVYYAHNLPESLKVKDLLITADIEMVHSDEVISTYTYGANHMQIHVLNASSKPE